MERNLRGMGAVMTVRAAGFERATRKHTLAIRGRG